MRILMFAVLLFLTSCGSQMQRPSNASNYETEMQVPTETENYLLVKQEILDDPWLGVMINYQDKAFSQDLITLYVYPIPSTTWDDTETTLSSELDAVLYEIDTVVSMGHYQSRSPETKSDIVFSADEAEFSGKKASFSFIDKEGREFDSEAYIFLREDKFIKFRTSFDSGITPNISGDEAVKEILPGVIVPSESEFARHVREERREQMSQQLLQLIMQAVKEAETEESAEAP